MDHIFLDANVLFSAAYRLDSRLNDLWSFQDIELVTSYLAAEEARRNLNIHKPEAVSQLEKLLESVILYGESGIRLTIPEEIELAEKDVPILTAAIQAKCTHLVTGDNQHFGHLFGSIVNGVKVMTPAQYFRDRADMTKRKPDELSVLAEQLRIDAKEQGITREDLDNAIAEVRDGNSDSNLADG